MVESLLAAGVEVNVKGQGVVAAQQTQIQRGPAKKLCGYKAVQELTDVVIPIPLELLDFACAEAAGYLGNTAVSRACRRGHDSVLRVLLLALGSSLRLCLCIFHCS